MSQVDEALDALSKSTLRYQRTEKEHEKSRETSIADVVAALRAGARPTDVVNRSPFSPAYVRKLAREHGIEPATKKEGDA
ncbi:hypothetical protein HNR23_002312 [Nocardiopsis mwathae]|uniref:Uncharacterized protein n=1 Tax=Nocardiopsis mwathae TaxID=1472723 RepID=A0A7W9YHK0_9ACTN|nr:hypothetical protein [Nocardiopsis mwathae]MBB6172252.1 hypothetical protein [Nocardiopsis mwathae]